MTPERFMIDSMIFDKIIDEPTAAELVRRLATSGVLVLLATHVQIDEVARTSDEDRRNRLLAVPVESVPTYGVVLGISRLGQARLSESEPLETLRGDNLDHTEDALIAATAQYEGVTLVTEDRTLTSRAGNQGIPVCNWQAFLGRLQKLASPLA